MNQSSTMADDKIPSYGRGVLLELAIAKGISYDRQKVTLRIPSKNEVLSDLKKAGVKDPHRLLFDIQKLKRRIKRWILQQKAKDLNVYVQEIKDDPFKLAIHIYCKDSNALEEIAKYQKTEQRRKTIQYDSKVRLTLDDWIQKESKIKKIVEKKLSDSESDSIATLDRMTQLGDTVRCEIGIDYKTRIVERKPSPQFPHREGSYDAYPLRKMVATYDFEKKTFQVSSHPKKTPILMEAFSEALTGEKDSFEVRKPTVQKAVESLGDPKIQKQLAENNIAITELLLLKVPIDGNPSFMHLKGEDLFQTMNLFEKSDIHLIGNNLSKISMITFDFNREKSVTIHFTDGTWDKAGDFSHDDESKINKILESWGV